MQNIFYVIYSTIDICRESVYQKSSNFSWDRGNGTRCDTYANARNLFSLYYKCIFAKMDSIAKNACVCISKKLCRQTISQSELEHGGKLGMSD